MWYISSFLVDLSGLLERSIEYLSFRASHVFFINDSNSFLLLFDLKNFLTSVPVLLNKQVNRLPSGDNLSLVQLPQKGCLTLSDGSYDINSKCAGKLWPWRIQWWVKLYFPTLWGRHGGFWSRRMPQNLESQPIDFKWKSKIWCDFHKKVVIRS